MSISAISGSSWLSQAQTQLQSSTSAANGTVAGATETSASAGAAAILELSGTAQSATTGSGGAAQAGGSSSASSTCPVGNAECTGCGQCGKITVSSLSASAAGTQANAQTTTTADYLTATAINAYENASRFL